jgi:sulfur-oxidizing protein SoxY
LAPMLGYDAPNATRLSRDLAGNAILRKMKPMTVSRRAFRALFAAALGVSLATSAGVAAPSEPADEFWPALKRDLFQNRDISENSGVVTLETPMKAEDAALVPMTMSVGLPQGDSRRVVKMSLVIDENPVPLAGTFTLGDKGGVVQIETRVRVNADTYVHLVAELSDGSLTEAKRYVSAAGGCSSPSIKTLDALGSSLGQLKFILLPDLVHGRRAAVVMIRHPNFTGMQMDDRTHDYTPARYVDHFAVYQDNDLVFSVDGGISISEDPNFRFAFAAGPNRTLRVEASDNSGARFTSSWPILASGG